MPAGDDNSEIAQLAQFVDGQFQADTITEHRDVQEEDHHEQLPAYSKDDPNKPTEPQSKTGVGIALTTPGEYATQTAQRSTWRTPSSSGSESSRVHTFRIGSEINSEARIQKRKLQRRRCCLIFWVIAIVVVAVVVGAVVGTRKKAPSPRKYSIQEHYQGNTFFDNFDFYTETGDESFKNSFVNQTEATRLGLAQVFPNGTASIAINNQSSVRLVSKKTFGAGLYVFRIDDHPLACNQMPTIRLSSSGHFPAENDITVFQSRGLTTDRYFTLQTTGSCKLASQAQFAKSGSTTTVCQNRTSDDQQCRTFLKYNTGGYFSPKAMVMELSSEGVRSWLIDLNSQLSQLGSDTLDISTWADPDVFFPADQCDMTANFPNMHIVADIARCGDYGYYDDRWNWWSGSWCERDCQMTANLTSLYRSSTWKWSEWKIYARIE